MLCATGLLANLPALAQAPQIDTATAVIREHKEHIRRTLEVLEPAGARAEQAAAAKGAPQGDRQTKSNTAPADTARDPFALTPEMLQGGTAAESGAGTAAGRLPALRLRGLARGSGEAAYALIEIEGQGKAPVMLRLGDELTLQGADGGMTIKLARIGAASIEIETSQGRRVVVR